MFISYHLYLKTDCKVVILKNVHGPEVRREKPLCKLVLCISAFFLLRLEAFFIKMHL
jgi:hypothetical protein